MFKDWKDCLGNLGVGDFTPLKEGKSRMSNYKGLCVLNGLRKSDSH